MCRSRFPSIVCRPIAAQFLPGNTICLFEFDITENSERIAAEKHYRLVSPEEIDSEDLRRYALDRSD